MSGAWSSPPRSDTASTAIAFEAPVAHRLVPSRGIDGDVERGRAAPSAFAAAACAVPTRSPM